MKIDKQQLQQLKDTGRKIVALTCYDYPFARVAEALDIDILLVGDSLGTNVLGYTDVTQVTMPDMLHHVRAVVRGAPSKFILADMPWRSFETAADALVNARLLVDAGADAVKIEGNTEIIPRLAALTAAGINVCAHIGYLPQSHKKAVVQGNTIEQARALLASARALEANGAFLIVFELMPAELAAEISQLLTIPTIGIGAGACCDGQVQVLYDILGFSSRTFRHTRVFAPVAALASEAVAAYAAQVRNGTFPAAANAASLDPAVAAAITRP
jgi:3-methyl-2-oxobutanoate hydroxymethyltransferase